MMEAPQIQEEQNNNKKLKASIWITKQEYEWVNRNRNDISFNLYVRRLIKKDMMQLSGSEGTSQKPQTATSNTRTEVDVDDAVKTAPTTTTTTKTKEVEAVNS